MLSIYGYATASTDIAAYILGGHDDNDNAVSTIAEYRNDKWTKYGDLRSKRYRASAIFLNGEHLIIGGDLGSSYSDYPPPYRKYPVDKW